MHCGACRPARRQRRASPAPIAATQPGAPSCGRVQWPGMHSLTDASRCFAMLHHLVADLLACRHVQRSRGAAAKHDHESYCSA